MTPYYSDPLVTLYHGDCLEVMAALDAESVDAVVTDPPAGIAFMSKHWDRDKGGRTKWVAWMTEVMRECHRVLKPGGYAVVWSIPRTCHWTGWAIEDAGFRMVDQLAHVFASGFPKGRTQLKPAREDWWLARKPGKLRELAIDECRIPGQWTTWRRSDGSIHPVAGFGSWYVGGNDRPENVRQEEHPAGRWPSNVLLDPDHPELFDQPNPYVVGSGAVSDAGPAHMLRRGQNGQGIGLGSTAEGGDVDGVLYGDSGGYSRYFVIPKADRAERERGMSSPVDYDHSGPRGHTLNGDGTPRPRPRPRPRANVHPTVKPIDLMRHLVKLVTPPGGVCLDPFLGSGTTALAASELGIRCIGIEREAEYLEIAKGRLMATPMGLGLDVPAGHKRPPKTHPDLSKHQPKRRAASDNYSGGWVGSDEVPA